MSNHCSGFETLDIVDRYVFDWKRTKFCWETQNCMLVIADYLQELTGIDCAEHLRGKFDDKESCERVTKAMSEPVALFEGCIARFSLQPTATPVRGDIGLIAIGDMFVGAVCLGDKWALKSKRGVVIVHKRLVYKAWGTQCLLF